MPASKKTRRRRRRHVGGGNRNNSSRRNTAQNNTQPNVLYEDDSICILKRGGVPVYSLVGYIETPNEKGAANVCKEGLKTYEHLFETQVFPTAMVEEIGNTPENWKAWYEMFVEDDVPVEARKKTITQNNLKREYFKLETERTGRNEFLKNNADRLRYIFFRAPMCWPFALEGDTVVQREDLKDVETREFYYQRSVAERMARVNNPSKQAEAMVEIRVDPKRTRVFNAFLRTLPGITKEALLSSSMRLDAYLEMLKKDGPSALQNEGEILAMPPTGVLPPAVFSNCWTKADPSEPVSTEPYQTLFRKGVRQSNKRQEAIINIREMIAYMQDIIDTHLKPIHTKYTGNKQRIYNLLAHIDTAIVGPALILTQMFDVSSYELSYLESLFQYASRLAYNLATKKKDEELRVEYVNVAKTLAEIATKNVIGPRVATDKLIDPTDSIQEVPQAVYIQLPVHLKAIERAFDERL